MILKKYNKQGELRMKKINMEYAEKLINKNIDFIIDLAIKNTTFGKDGRSVIPKNEEDEWNDDDELYKY